MNVSRRGFAIRLVALMVAGLAHPALAQDTLSGFRSLSARLTGFSREEIDPELASDMMEGLRAAGRGDELDHWLGTGTGSGDLAREITVAWYSGIHPGAAGKSLRAYDEALVWRALDFARPPGRCGMAPGDWSKPPAGAVQ